MRPNDESTSRPAGATPSTGSTSGSTSASTPAATPRTAPAAPSRPASAPVANTSGAGANLPPSDDAGTVPHTPSPNIVRSRSQIAEDDAQLRRRLTPEQYDAHLKTRALQEEEAQERAAEAAAQEEQKASEGTST